MCKILIIDHDPLIVRVIKLILRREEGYLVVSASNGKEGMAALGSDKYDLVITDLLLPYASGTEIIAWVRKNSSHPNFDTPILILTAFQTEDSVIDGFDAGANDYLKKPFTPGELLSRVKRLSKNCASTN